MEVFSVVLIFGIIGFIVYLVLSFVKKNNTNTSKLIGSAPEWNEYYPNLVNANDKQRKFYYYWLQEFQKGNYIEINGNLSYLFVCIYAILGHFLDTKNIDYLNKNFNKIRNGYSKKYNKINQYLDKWEADAYIYIKDYENAWKCIKKSRALRADDFLNIRGKCKDKSISASEVFNMLKTNNGLSELGKRNKKEIIPFLDNLLKDFFYKNKFNFIEYLWLKNREKIFPGRIQNDKCYLFAGAAIREKEEDQNNNQNGVILGMEINGVPVRNNPEYKCINIPFEAYKPILKELRKLVKKAENRYRESKNIPKIGEGWVSETELFYELKEAFPNEKIIHHGKPKWLKPQHLDIYFPNRRIGIEYQGAQHFKPIEFFGGEKAFQETKKRDKRKKMLCTKHNFKLIFVTEEDNYRDIINKIKGNFSVDS